jgi:hypothetical protein
MISEKISAKVQYKRIKREKTSGYRYRRRVPFSTACNKLSGTSSYST